MPHLPGYIKQHTHLHGVHASLLCRGTNAQIPISHKLPLKRPLDTIDAGALLFFTLAHTPDASKRETYMNQLVFTSFFLLVVSQCIEKYIRVRKKECPQCRMHCSSKRSLRPDKRFDSNTLPERIDGHFTCADCPVCFSALV
jgi:hypothetical protein